MPTVNENMLGALRLLEALHGRGVSAMLTLAGPGLLAVRVSHEDRKNVFTFPVDQIERGYRTADGVHLKALLDRLVEEVKKPRCKICGRPVDDGVQFCGGDDCVPL